MELKQIDLHTDDGQARLGRLFRYAQIGRCISSVTHDINNFLGAIMAYAELIDLDGNLCEDSRRMLREITEAVRRSSGLVGNLTDVARRERSDVRIIDPKELVERVVQIRQYDMKTNQVAYTVEAAGPSSNMSVDLPKVQQALMYLVSNAIEALEGADCRRVRLRVENEPRFVELSVWDSGPGIPEESREDVFRPFFTTKGGEHLGLGLTVARQTARAHEGDLFFEPERGFVMRLPKEGRITTQAGA